MDNKNYYVDKENNTLTFKNTQTLLNVTLKSIYVITKEYAPKYIQQNFDCKLNVKRITIGSGFKEEIIDSDYIFEFKTSEELEKCVKKIESIEVYYNLIKCQK